MRVPVLERQVQQNPTLINAPQISKAVPGAFGEDVAVATQNVGKAGMQVSAALQKHIELRNDYANRTKKDDLVTKYSNDLTNMLLSTEMETYTVKGENGQDIVRERPVGAINQKGDDAHEATFRFQEKAIPLAEQYISQVKDPKYQVALREDLMMQYRTRYDQIVAHETNETNQANRDRSNTKLKTLANLFPSASPEDKQEIITKAYETIKADEDRGLYDYENTQKRIEQFNNTIVKTNMAVDPVQTLSELNKGKDGLYKDLTNEQSDYLKSEAYSLIKKLNEGYELNVIMSQFENQKMFEKNLDKMTISNAIDELDNGIFAGTYNKAWAESRKKAIFSTTGINETMMNEFEAKMIIKTDDLTAQYKVKDKKKRKREDAKVFLEGINNLKIELNEGKTKGLITQGTYNTLINKLNGTDVAEATGKVIKHGQFWAYDSKEAYNAFEKVLPTEDTYRAVRQFFNETGDRKLTKAEGIKAVSDIVDRIKTDNRNEILADNDLAIEKKSETPSFATEAEAEKANLPVGSLVIIDGKTYRVKP